MSELIQKKVSQTGVRWKLLTGASALALTAYAASVPANAEDSDKPQLWIELGTQLNRLQDSSETYRPPFLALTPSIFPAPQASERPPLYGFDGTAALTFQPKGSDWTFSASVRYGRADTGKHAHHQTYPVPYQLHAKNGGDAGTQYPLAEKFTDVRFKQVEENAILDFQVGRDLGVGLFGHETSSSLHLGVRFAQFISKSRSTLSEDPDWHFSPEYLRHLVGTKYQPIVLQQYHSYHGSFIADRSFSGLGPALSWKSSLPIAGNSQRGELVLDWGVNGAVLFGRQKVKTQHQTSAWYHSEKTHKPATRSPKVRHLVYQTSPAAQSRSNSVMVPNVGGFAGLSVRYDNAKVSLGYRADFFFGAIDGGIDSRRTYDRRFYGPYATVSIGLGG